MLFNIFQGEVINDFAFFLFTTKQNHHTPHAHTTKEGSTERRLPSFV